MHNHFGPQRTKPMERRERAQTLAKKLQQHYGEQLLGIAAYGSLARGRDALYSDIELFCVVRGEDVEQNLEWSTGPWKAEINILSAAVLLGRAKEVAGDWAVTHGAFVHTWPLYDPAGFFRQLREAAQTPAEAAVRSAMHAVVIGELYELVGKIRNTQLTGQAYSLPMFMMELTHHTACLLGLAHHHLYISASTIFAESLKLPSRPAGYDELCHLVTKGELSQLSRNWLVCETFWHGLLEWVAPYELPLEQTLDQLLLKNSLRP